MGLRSNYRQVVKIVLSKNQAQRLNQVDNLDMENVIRGAVIEDLDYMQEIVGRILQRGGLVVEDWVKDRNAALEFVPKMEQLELDFVTLDGNLGESKDGQDGRDVLNLIRQLYGDRIVVAAIASEDFSAGNVNQVDVSLDKGNLEYLREEIPQRIKELVSEKRQNIILK